jgi:hypothetical protein
MNQIIPKGNSTPILEHRSEDAQDIGVVQRVSQLIENLKIGLVGANSFFALALGGERVASSIKAVWIEGGITIDVATIIFLRTVTLTLLHSLSPTGVIFLPESIWIVAAVVFQKIRAPHKEKLLEMKVARLEEVNQAQGSRIDRLALDVRVHEVANEKLVWEKGGVTQERDSALQDRESLIAEKAGLLREKDDLHAKNEQLIRDLKVSSQDREQLMIDRAQIASLHEALEKDYAKLSEALEEARGSLSQSGEYQKLNDCLSELNRLCREKREGSRVIPFKMVLGDLMSQYRGHRDYLHQQLKETITQLSDNESAQVLMKAVLRLSEEQSFYIAGIFQAVEVSQFVCDPTC